MRSWDLLSLRLRYTLIASGGRLHREVQELYIFNDIIIFEKFKGCFKDTFIYKDIMITRQGLPAP